MSVRRYLKRLLSPNKVIVLMYHRVADVEADPWQLAVSPANFEAQLKLLKKRFAVISTEELAHQLSRKHIRQNAVCLTFDDGYLDNYTAAKPLLEKHQLAGSFFISTYFVENDRPFWWDELQEIIFSTPVLPSPFVFEINGETISCVLENCGRLTPEQTAKQNNWVWSDKPPTQRCWLYFALWEKMQPQSQRAIEGIIMELRQKIGDAEVDMHGAVPMTIDQLKQASRSSYVQIGLHTHTHPALTFHTKAFQQNELIENKRLLENWCNSRIATLTYPHGKANDDTVSIVKDLQLSIAFNTTGNLVSAKSNPYALGRHQVLNWNADEFSRAINKILG